MRRPPTSISTSEQQARRSPAYLSQANTKTSHRLRPHYSENNQNVSVVLSLIEMAQAAESDAKRHE